MNGASEKLSSLLGVPAEQLHWIFEEASKRTGKNGALDLANAIEASTNHALLKLNVTGRLYESVSSALEQAISMHAEEMRTLAEKMPGENEFERAASLAREIIKVPKGFFLKRDRAASILKARPAENVLKYLNIPTVEELLSRHDVAEIMSVLRFMETDEWMHETFEIAYSTFTPQDFEERDIEIRVLGPVWQPVAAEFVKKKHHNVSHLKELGVIFVNPIREDLAVKFLRDFALLFHYVHEVDFYSQLFRRYAASQDFSTHLKSLLRGDVPEKSEAAPGEWLIVQRYLAKINPTDPRLFLPHLNPESLHWHKAERDLASYALAHNLGLGLWRDMDWVGWLAPNRRLISFDLEDVAMSAVDAGEGGHHEFLTYHEREALWTELFSRYVGGEENMEKLLMDNFEKGSIQL